MTDVATSFEPHVWGDVVLNCDAAAHRWQGPNRFKGLFDGLTARLKKGPKGEDEFYLLARSAATQLGVSAHMFARQHAHFSRKLVKSFVNSDTFRRQFGLFMENARKTRTPPPRRVRERYAPNSELADAYERLSVLTQQVCESLNSPSIERVAFLVRTPDKQRTLDALWFVYDPGVPSEIVDAQLGRVESEAAQMLMSGKSWTDADLLKFLEFRIASFGRWARFVAGLRGSSVPSIPTQERLDVGAIVERNKAVRAKLEEQTPRIRREIAGG